MTLISRPARRDDLDAVVDLYRRYERATRGFPDTDPADVAGDWEGPDFDLRTGTRVLEQDGRLVGYAIVLRDGEADSCVDPDLRGTGPEEQLLGWLEERGAREHYVPAEDPVLPPLLEGRGWYPARRFWRMRRELDGPTPEPSWPSGVHVRDLDVERDARPVHELIQKAFAEIGGQHQRSFEQWSAALLRDDRFDPALCLVAVEQPELRIVGAAMTQDVGDYGFVRQLAVPPEHRGRGIALALLHETFGRHAARGLPATALGVDAGNRTGALALYERAGMRLHEQFVRWERDTG